MPGIGNSGVAVQIDGYSKTEADERLDSIDYNYFINPDFRIDQRALSNTVLNAGGSNFFADRWLIRGVSNTGGTIQRGNYSSNWGTHSIPGGGYTRLDFTGLTDTTYLLQKLEGLYRFTDADFYLGFYGQSDNGCSVLVRTYYIHPSDGSTELVGEWWHDIPAGSDAAHYGKAIHFPVSESDVASDDSYLYISFSLVGVGRIGPTPDGPCRFGAFQLTRGKQRRPYLIPDPEEEMARCQRYYYKDMGSDHVLIVTSTPVIAKYYNVNFPVAMRTTPALSVTSLDGAAIQYMAISTTGARVSIGSPGIEEFDRIDTFAADAEI